MYCGSWVDFPQPVSPTTTTTCNQQYNNYLSKQQKQPVKNNVQKLPLNNKNLKTTLKKLTLRRIRREKKLVLVENKYFFMKKYQKRTRIKRIKRMKKPCLLILFFPQIIKIMSPSEIGRGVFHKNMQPWVNHC